MLIASYKCKLEERINQEIYLPERIYSCMMYTMQNVDLEEFKDLYIKTAVEYVHILKDKLEEYTTEGNKNLLQALFMASHSLKGQSYAMNYNDIGKVSREIELFFQDAQNLKRIPQSNELDAIGELIEYLSLSIESIQNNSVEIPLDQNHNNLLSLIHKNSYTI